jgi:cytochrome c peroxidase
MNMKTTLLSLMLTLLFTTLLMPQELTLKEQLGKKLFFDKISEPSRQSCASCHAPEAGYAGAISGINQNGSVYPGAVPQRFGNRKPPSAAYATFSPIFHYDAATGHFVGGNFSDGRATGDILGNPAADQAMGPYLNPVEQNNSSKKAVLMQIEKSKYYWMWPLVWDEPIDYSTEEAINLNYGRVALAVMEYEASAEVNPFSSKFDYFLKGEVELSPQEARGMDLFKDANKGNCAVCHLIDPGPNGEPPLFTEFEYYNVGTPKNPKNPFYKMDKVFLPDGNAINPEGKDWIDKGLGGFLETHDNPEWRELADANMGKHKIPTLRNIDKRPGNGFKRAYLHNGFFTSLKEVVHFYNTRDVEGNNWPPPEVEENINRIDMGNLGLTDDEEDAIVAFMATLSDGYKIHKAKENQVAALSANLIIDGPNPFNPTTKLNYYIPEDSHIQLDVFNINGEKVTTLQQGFMSAGEHHVIFNGNNLSSGIYLVNLNTGKDMKTVKLVLLK